MPSWIVIKKNRIISRFEMAQIMGNENNFRAREITSNFFEGIENKINLGDIREKDIWIFNDIFFSGIALPLTRVEKFLLENVDANEIALEGDGSIFCEIIACWCKSKGITFEDRTIKETVISYLKSISIDVLLAFYSVFSVLIGSFHRPKAVIWTGDFSTSIDRVRDPRWGNLYDALTGLGIPYCEMVRTTIQSPQKILQNLSQRNWGVFYYQSFWNILSLFQKNHKFEVKNPDDLFLVELFSKYYPAIKTLPVTEKIISYALALLRPKIVYTFCITSRSAPLVWGAQKRNISTVGIMHGMSSRSYMGHEYLENYKGSFIGNDFYGVWSKYWKEQFDEYSKLFRPSQIQVSGPQKKNPPFCPIVIKESPIKKILWISEQEIDIDEFLPYFEVLNKNRYDITLKIRPFGKDKFYEKIKDLNLPLEISNEFLENVVQNFDVVIGSHSTAVLESTIYGKPFFMFNSKKWGDVFDLQQYSSILQVFNNNPEQLLLSVAGLQQFSGAQAVYKKIRDSYFGEQSGTDWLLGFLKEDS